jgi:hypothetical protein
MVFWFVVVKDNTIVLKVGGAKIKSEKKEKKVRR